MLAVFAVVSGGFYVSGLLFHVIGTPPWLLGPVKTSTSSELYSGYFRLLYFWQAFPSHFTASATILSRHFLPAGVFYLTLLPYIFGTFCDSDAGRNTPSRILLCACPHRVVPSRWRMVLNYSYCSHKTIDLSIAPVSHKA